MKGLLDGLTGIVFKRPDEKALYIAGDTIGRKAVEVNLIKHHPEVLAIWNQWTAPRYPEKRYVNFLAKKAWCSVFGYRKMVSCLVSRNPWFYETEGVTISIWRVKFKISKQERYKPVVRFNCLVSVYAFFEQFVSILSTVNKAHNWQNHPKHPYYIWIRGGGKWKIYDSSYCYSTICRIMTRLSKTEHSSFDLCSKISYMWWLFVVAPIFTDFLSSPHI